MENRSILQIKYKMVEEIHIMGTGLVINGLSTGGEVYKLKSDINIQEAHQKGLKDGLDQMYFTVGEDKYVLQGDNLMLGEAKAVMSKEVPSTVIKLDGKAVEINIEAMDDEVSSIMDGFVQNGQVASYSGTAIAVGVPVAALSGLSWIITEKAGSAMGSKLASGGIYLGTAAVVGGAIGLAYYAGKSVYQGASNTPKPAQTESMKLSEFVNTQNEAKSAGRVSVAAKAEAAKEVATDILLDTAFDLIFD